MGHERALSDGTDGRVTGRRWAEVIAPAITQGILSLTAPISSTIQWAAERIRGVVASVDSPNVNVYASVGFGNLIGHQVIRRDIRSIICDMSGLRF